VEYKLNEEGPLPHGPTCRNVSNIYYLHTGEWNTKVIWKVLYLMDHHALT